MARQGTVSVTLRGHASSGPDPRGFTTLLVVLSVSLAAFPGSTRHACPVALYASAYSSPIASTHHETLQSIDSLEQQPRRRCLLLRNCDVRSHRHTSSEL